jgi:hypothetical protein
MNLVNWILTNMDIDLEKYSWDIVGKETDKNGTKLNVRVYERN